MKRKLKLTRQLEAADCGPACLHMIANYYGRNCTIDEIKQSCEMTRLGISMLDIRRCASLIGLECFSVKVNAESLVRMPCPAILYFKRGHFVVLERIRDTSKGSEYVIADPENGRIKLHQEDMENGFFSDGYGIAAMFAPDPDYDGKDSLVKLREKSGLLRKTIIDIFIPRRKKLLIIALLSLITVAANWAMPLLLKTTIDEGILNRDMGVVCIMLIAQLAFFLGFLLSNTVSSIVAIKTGMQISIDFISNYFNKIISLPISFFDMGQRTDLIRKLGDLSRIQSFTSGEIVSFVLALLNIIVFSSLLLYYNPVIFLIFIGFSIVSFFYNSHFIKKRKLIDYASFSINSERDNLIHELVTGMHEIKLNNAQKARISHWRNLENKSNSVQLKALFNDNYLSSGGNIFSRLRDITITGLCAFMVIEGDLSMGIMMMISFLLGQLSGPISQTIGFIKSLQDVKLSYKRLENVYEQLEEENLDNTKNIENGDILFSGVSFKYKGAGNPNVLNNIDLTIPKGKITAIVGASGSGKSTLLKLILGFYPPSSGDIYVSSYKITDLNLNTWRGKWGVVLQDGRIFSGTVAENIAIADETPDPDKLRYACEIACIYDKIKSLPMQFNTRIGETGIELSGGEKQRILIARAVYKNPDYILLDEATSSLDASTEKKIMKNLYDFYKGRTVVIIAHRLSTVKNAHNIVFLDNGCIVEEGTHQELLAAKGRYHDLVGNQLEIEVSV